MSVSDPLIKELKGFTAKFLEAHRTNGSVEDSNPHLIPFCACLEKIFTNGVVSQPNSFGFIRRNDPWTCFEKIAGVKYDLVPYCFVSAVENARDCKNVFSNVGKFRLLLRHCLARKCLHVPVEYMINSGKTANFYDLNSILGDEILSAIFLSVLYQCGKINFKLNLSNTSFLDLSWMLPEVVVVELVPAHHLGEKAVISKIRSNSVSAECSKISVGDVLDNLNGVCICSATQGRLSSLLKCQKGRPINLTLVKAMYSNTRQYYPPILKLFKDVGLDPEIVKSQMDECLDKEESEELSLTPAIKKIGSGFKVIYVGNVDVGRTGDVKLIDKAFSALFSTNTSLYAHKCKKVKSEILFEVGELGVRSLSRKTNEVVLKHSFMDISACGSIMFMPNYFAYVAGDEICTVSKHFFCYIFMAPSDEIAYTILQGIGQGFQRTHYAV